MLDRPTEVNPPRCECERGGIRYRRRTNGVDVYVMQCLSCGRELRAVSKHSPEVRALAERTPFDETLQDQWRERQRQYWEDWRQEQADLREEQRATYEAEHEAEQAAWWARYEAHLRSKAWRDRRTRVLERAGGMCEGCGIRYATQVHHLTYDHMGNELLFELVAVCNACHQQLHPDKDLA